MRDRLRDPLRDPVRDPLRDRLRDPVRDPYSERPPPAAYGIRGDVTTTTKPPSQKEVFDYSHKATK